MTTHSTATFHDRPSKLVQDCINFRFYWSKGWWRRRVVTTELLELQVVQSSGQIITTNKPTSSFFYRLDALPVAQPTVSTQITVGNKSHLQTWSPQAHHHYVDHMLLVTLEGGRVAKPYVSCLQAGCPSCLAVIHMQYDTLTLPCNAKAVTKKQVTARAYAAFCTVDISQQN